MGSKEREIGELTEDEKAQRYRERLDELDQAEVGKKLIEVASLMRLEVHSENQIYQEWINSMGRQHEVLMVGSLRDIEQALCDVQGTWMQLPILMTRKGAKIGRFMLARYMASTNIQNGRMAALPVLGLEKELYRKDNKEEKRKWIYGYRSANISAVDLVTAAKGPLMTAIEAITGPLTMPLRADPQGFEKLAHSMRAVLWPNNNDSLSRWLFEHQESRVVKSGEKDPLFDMFTSRPGRTRHE